MKLLNYTLLYFSIALLLIIGVWATLFYFEMLDEVYDSIDDGLDNYKTLIIQKAATDTSVLHKTSFAESNYSINEISPTEALKIKDVYTDTTMYMQNEDDFEPVRVLSSAFVNKDGRYFELKVISSMVEEDDLIEDLLYSLLWLYLAMVLSIILLNNIILMRIWMPFYKQLERLKNFRLGNMDTYAQSPTNIKEFKDLHEVITVMLQRNNDIYLSQKQFIENASHELQTPLAISLNKLELLSQAQNLSEETVETIDNVINNLGRLTRLNQSLLMLSKVENQQYTKEEDTDFGNMASYIVEQLKELADFRSIAININIQGLFVKKANPELAHILLSNLIKNAIVHNQERGHISIDITNNYFSISNSGPSEPLDENKIFNRFQKNNAERTGSGLGLAIVKAIANRYNLSVYYKKKDGNHRFTIS